MADPPRPRPRSRPGPRAAVALLSGALLAGPVALAGSDSTQVAGGTTATTRSPHVPASAPGSPRVARETPWRVVLAFDTTTGGVTTAAAPGPSRGGLPPRATTATPEPTNQPDSES